MPLTIPVVEPTVATTALPLDHVPPVVVLDNVIVCPAQTEAGPEIADGNAFTLTTVVDAQPEAKA